MSDLLDTIFHFALLSRVRHLGLTNLSHHLAIGAAVRLAWAGGVTCIVGIIGPPRDYLFAATFPAWMVFAPGITPVLADSATYVGIVALGHAVMRLVPGPSLEDRLRNES